MPQAMPLCHSCLQLCSLFLPVPFSLFKQCRDLPRHICFTGRSICVLERRSLRNVPCAGFELIVRVLLSIVLEDPRLDDAQRFRILHHGLPIGMMVELPRVEAHALGERYALETALSIRDHSALLELETYRSLLWTLKASGICSFPPFCRQAAREYPSSIAITAPLPDVGMKG